MRLMSKLKLLKMPYKYYIVTSIGEKENNKRIKTFLVQSVLTLLFINAVIFFIFYLIMLIYG